MAESTRDNQDLESTTIKIYRTSTVVKGGRRFSYGALVAMGDRRGKVGLGYGKAPGVPAAIEKAQKEARKRLEPVVLQGGTLPHPVTSRFGASSVKLVPAAPGTGVIAGGTVRAVLELAGVKDCLTKSYGSNSQQNLSKATLQGLQQLRSKQAIEELRGVELEKTDVELRVEMGERYAPAASTSESRMQAPRNEVGQQQRGGRRGGGGRGRGGGGRGGDRGGSAGSPTPEPQAAANQSAPAPAETPAAEGSTGGGGESKPEGGGES